MSFAKTWRFLAFGAGLLAGGIIPRAEAAWPQPKGELLIISTLSDYRAKARFDALGARAQAGRYHKQELSFYSVYGITEALTLGAQPTFVRLRARSAIGGERESVDTLSHVEMFARQRLLAGDAWVLSTQALVKLPRASAVEREPLLESSNRDFEGRLLFGRSGTSGKYLFNLEYFSTLEAGIRVRDHGAADQGRMDATFGLRAWPGYQFIAQGFNTVALHRGDGLDSSEFDLYKAQISVLRDLPKGMAVQIGGFSEYAGRNISAGNAFFMAIWSRF